MLRTTLVVLLSAPAAMAQFVYDFNALTGSDPHPFTMLHGQDGWSEQTFNAANRCGVTATLAFDGSKGLRFQEVGPGYGCDASRLNDANWFYPAFAGSETNAFFQADLQVGYWGGSFGLACDTNTNGMIRAAEAGERGVRFNVGTQANVQLMLVAADQTFVRVPLSSLGTVSGGHWLRIRVVMDLAAAAGAGRGFVEVQNLTAGATVFTAVPGLQDVPLGLNPTATDATNPTRWQAMWLHFEGATYGLDNIEVGRIGFGRAYGSGCNGAAGPVSLLLLGDPRPASTVRLVSDNHAAGALGFVIFGFRNNSYGGQSLPFLLDPLLGTSGCSLHVSIDASLLAFAAASSPAPLVLPVTLPPTWTGNRFYVQHACLEPVPGGMSWSNGLILQLP